MHSVALDLQKPGDIAARTVQPIRTSDHDHPNVRIIVHRLNDRSYLRTALEADCIHGGTIKNQITGLFAIVLFPTQAIEILRVLSHYLSPVTCFFGPGFCDFAPSRKSPR